MAADGPLLLISANSAWNVVNFRLDLVRALQEAGYRVAVAASADEQAPALGAAGVQFLPLSIRATGLSPLEDAALLARYLRLMRLLRPAAYLGFTAKANIYGSLAARLCGISTVNTLTGLGTTFIHRRPIEKLVSGLYRLALRRSKAVFFHNPDDRDLFVERRLVAREQADVVAGSGIDLSRFTPAPLPGDHRAPNFLFVGRLLWEKGIGEFVEAAHSVRSRYPEARFLVVGELGDGRRGVPERLLRDWVAEGAVDYLGTCPDVRPLIARADCVVLPSWREGLPRVLLEAAAMGRPSIASDAPGCRHAVVDGVTGLVSETRSSASLASCFIRMIELGAAERQAMGSRARAYAEEHFGVERVEAMYLRVLDRIMAGARVQRVVNA